MKVHYDISESLISGILTLLNFTHPLAGQKKFQAFLQTLYSTIPAVIQRCLADQTMDKKIVGNTREYLQLLTRAISKQK